MSNNVLNQAWVPLVLGAVVLALIRLVLPCLRSLFPSKRYRGGRDDWR